MPEKHYSELRQPHLDPLGSAWAVDLISLGQRRAHAGDGRRTCTRVEQDGERRGTKARPIAFRIPQRVPGAEFGEHVSRGMGATTPEKRPKAEVVANLMTPGLPNMTEGSSSSEQELRLVPQPSLPVP